MLNYISDKIRILHFKMHHSEELLRILYSYWKQCSTIIKSSSLLVASNKCHQVMSLCSFFKCKLGNAFLAKWIWLKQHHEVVNHIWFKCSLAHQNKLINTFHHKHIQKCVKHWCNIKKPRLREGKCKCKVPKKQNSNILVTAY